MYDLYGIIQKTFLQTTLNNLRNEISQLKSDKVALESQVQILLHENLNKLKNSPKSQYQSNDPDIFNEIKSRLSRERNILLFNLPDYEHECLDIPSKIGIDLFDDLSLSNLKITCSKCLGNFYSKNRSILLEFDSPSNVLEILKSKNKLRLTERWRQVSISEVRTISQRSHNRQLRFKLSKRREHGENNWIIKYNTATPYLVHKN